MPKHPLLALWLAGTAFAATPATDKPAYPLPTCATPTTTTASAPREQGSPEVRQAAQRGLNFLARETLAWQKQQSCYGCHVHAVTLEAMALGVHNQYDVSRTQLTAILEGMLRLPGGARRPQGLSYHDDSLFAPAKAFGGAAFARYDQWVGTDVRDDLVRAARELLEYQQRDGSIRLDWTNPPVGAGVLQGTFQATQTWRQAYARTADDKWLTPIRKAEGFIQAQVAHWGQAPRSIQDTDYALMALLAAGVSPSEPSVRRLVSDVLKSQRPDGGWGFTANEAPNAFATGQALYTLRLLGMTDQDPVIGRGTRWITSHQQQDGGWSHAGFGKAEAMWGVLGLVSMDVLTVAVNGPRDGQHVEGVQRVTAEARDNQSGGVARIEFFVDDVRTYAACGGKLDYAWNTAGLEKGKHLVDVIATNAKGQRSARRLEVYAGSVYLTELGSSFSSDGTVFSLRDIAPETLKGSIQLEIKKPADKGAGATVYTASHANEPGPLSFTWSGKSNDGKPQPRGRYTAVVSFKDPSGQVLQREELTFTHDTEEAQQAHYAQVQGKLDLGNAAPAANTAVELVDDRGNVVQRTLTTEAGQYRFKSVDPGKYKVRIQKRGFVDVEQSVDAAKGAEAEASSSLMAK